ncbi:MAG: hypothetical protein IPJ30_04395 [Acidobacteria bacterium]|nr:hypothetical protein [Acidobacteriota bacterium]
MKQNNLRRNLRIIGLAFSLVFGFIVITATSANAQNRNDRRNDDRTERRDDRDRTDRNRNNRNDDYDNNDRYDNNGRYDNNNGRYDNDRYNRNGYIVQQAYRAGMSQGIEDARDGRRYNANKAAGRAMGQVRVYNSRNQGEYKRIFREAFIRGYDEGYNRYNNRRNDRRRDNRDRRDNY